MGKGWNLDSFFDIKQHNAAFLVAIIRAAPPRPTGTLPRMGSVADFLLLINFYGYP